MVHIYALQGYPVNLKTTKTPTWSPYLEGEKWYEAGCIFIEWEGIHTHAAHVRFGSSHEPKKKLVLCDVKEHPTWDDNKLVKANELITTITS